MHVVQDQRYRRGHRRKCRPQPRDDRARHRTRRGRQCVEHPLTDRLDRIEGFGDVGKQDLRVIVRFVNRHPRDGLGVVVGPLRQQRRLPVTRWRDHRDDGPSIVIDQPFDETGTADSPWPDQGAQELRRVEVERRPARTLRSVDSLTHVAATHARYRPRRPASMLIRNLEPGQAAIRPRRANNYQIWALPACGGWRRRATTARDARARRSRRLPQLSRRTAICLGRFTPDGWSAASEISAMVMTVTVSGRGRDRRCACRAWNVADPLATGIAERRSSGSVNDHPPSGEAVAGK